MEEEYERRPPLFDDTTTDVGPADEEC
jgi:hypothetical protein